MKNDWIALLGIPLTVMVAPVFAVDYLTVEQAQQVIFPDAEVFSQHFVTLTKDQKKAIKKLSGKRQRWDEQEVWKVEKQGEHIGWFIVDNVVGKHEFITYALGISAAGETVSIEVISYRETHGDEVREAQWRDHFESKTISDPFKLEEDIPNITGATLSARNLTDGVKRLLALHQVTLVND